MMLKECPRTLANLKFLPVLLVIAVIVVALPSCKDKSKGKATANEENAPPPPPPPPPFTVINGDTVWTEVDVNPVYKGGEDAIRDYISHNINYPEAAKSKGIQGQVVVRFAVGSDGAISKLSILKGVDPELDKEAYRVVGTLPAFEKPGYENGRPVTVWYILPILFALD